MKHFITANWYRLLMVTSLLIFSTAFFISVIKNNVAIAGTPTKLTKEPPENRWIVANEKGIFEVTWDKTSYPYYKCDKIFDENGRR